MSEKSSTIDHVIGGTEEQRQKQLNHFAEIFEHQELGNITKYEREKTEDETYVLGLVNDTVNHIF